MDIRLKAYGKLNLTLNVKGSFEGGYHRLCGVATTVDVFDEVTLSKRQDKEIRASVIAKKNSFGGKTALRTAKAIADKYGVGGVDIKIEKGVPLCAGMGGSSAAAAAVICGMAALFNLPFDKDLYEIAAKYGSDITYLMKGGLALIEGKGDDITYLKYKKELYFTVIEGAPLITEEVFSQFDKSPDYTFYDSEELIKALFEGKIDKVRPFLGNNLQAAAIRQESSLAKIITLCDKLNLPAPVMTGSGGNFFILCDDFEVAQKYATELKAQDLDACALKSVPKAIV